MLIWRGNLLHLPDNTECIVEIVRSAVSYRKKKGLKITWVSLSVSISSFELKRMLLLKWRFDWQSWKLKVPRAEEN